MTTKTPNENADVMTDRKRQRASGEDSFVLVWFALLLVVLIAMAGFAVDVWGWWYTAQKEQRAADAAALAGVVFLPGDPATAFATARAAVRHNGYSDSDATITVGDKPNQLLVTIHQNVSNSFISVLGITTTSISRSATAEFNQPVKMGSPVAHLANDPEHPPVDQHWLNIGAPGVNKQTGDRYADYANCSGVYLCAGSTNGEYVQDTYVFTVDVPAGNPDIDIQVYDPEYANGNTACDGNWGGLTAANINGLMTAYPAMFPASDNPVARYGTGASMWCTGDDNSWLGTPQATAWLVRGPDPSGNPFQPLTNSVITSGGPGVGGACAKQFKGYNSDFYSLLNPASATFDADFYASFHRHYTLCHIPAAQAGRYFVQVRSNVPLQATPSIANLSKAENPPEDQSLAGQNRYSMRVVTHGTNTYAPGVNIYAETHLPIYSNVLNNASQTPLFYLARLLPGGGTSGRTLQLIFYDIGDLSTTGTTTITLTPPADATGSAPTCSWSANGGLAMPGGVVSGCTVSGINSNTYASGGYNGVLVQANVKVPGNYSCNFNDPLGCWFHIQMSYSANVQANDTTTWDANVAGDPVRLVK